MSALMGMLLKILFTEKMIKKLLLTLGNFLVASSKNKLDDKVWSMVKGRLKNTKDIVNLFILTPYKNRQ